MMRQQQDAHASPAVLCCVCSAPARCAYNIQAKRYYECPRCAALFLDPAAYLTAAEERRRYELHNNDVNDPRYQRFVEPIVAEIVARVERGGAGLDFGAGTGPVVATLLQANGYSMELYDPFFWPERAALKRTYDFITCCEVIEHFHAPAQEFALMRSLIRPGGIVCCKTDLLTDDTDFQSWYYKNDPTHVVFYHARTLAWLKKACDFSALEIRGRVVIFMA